MIRILVRGVGVGILAALIPALPARADVLEEIAKPAVGYKAARISSYDKSGGNADALTGILPGETAVLADIEGPGMVTHIWITVNAEKWHGRKLVLRMFWDGEKNPSVLTPLNDFFCMGHGIEAPVASLPITTTADGRARNSYFKMPFNGRARIEITNEGLEPVGAFYYYIDYRKYDAPLPSPVYFHAHYRQEYPARSGERYLICAAEGAGHYVGTVLNIESHSEGWWGEGDDRFFVDGETTPSLHGTGSEDYLNDAWGIWKGHSPFYGCSIHEGQPYIYPKGTRYTSYRFHIADPIPFKKSLRFDMEHWGAGVVNGRTEGFVERADNWSSVAYWYQTLPHAPLEPLAPADERLPDEAKSEKELLRFFRRAHEKPDEAAVARLRKAYAELAADETLAPHRPKLKARMAAAELAAGDRDAAVRLIESELSPFVHRSVVKELGASSALLGDALTPATPLLLPWDDGSAAVAEKDGTPGIATDPSGKKPMIYFAVPDDSPLRQKDNDIVMKVRYYSEGREGDTFLVHYNSSAAEGNPGAYRSSEVVKKSAEPGWHTAEIALPQARFAGRQNGGADFRVSDNGDGGEIIGGIEIVAPEN